MPGDCAASLLTEGEKYTIAYSTRSETNLCIAGDYEGVPPCYKRREILMVTSSPFVVPMSLKKTSFFSG